MTPIRSLLLFFLIGFVIAQDEPIPKIPPEKMPVRMRVEYEAAKAGDVFAMVRVNRWHYGLYVDYFPTSLVLVKLKELVKQGDARAMLALSTEMYREHPNLLVGTKEDKDVDLERRKLIEQAATLGEPEAMFAFASELEREKNMEEAEKWRSKGRAHYQDMAKQGDQEAIISMARFGRGVAGNNREEGMRKAAELAPHRFGYDFGQQIMNQKPVEGALWIEKAANEGDWIAMVEMGRFYAFGFPVSPARVVMDPVKHAHLLPKTDATKAWEWWDKAAALVGHDAVFSRLPEMGSKSFPKRPPKQP